MSNIIEISNLNYRIGKSEILHDINFVIPQGKICALLGKNGAGKSSIIKCILHLIQNYSGDILVDGVSARINKSRVNIAYIPEKEDLGSTSVKDFLIQQASYAGVNKKEAIDRIQMLCESLEYPFTNINRRVNSLSTGLKKIILIMQAFIINAKLVIADEPTSNLDFETRMLFYKCVKTLNKKGTTFLISSHDLFEIRNFANYYIQIKQGAIFNVSSTAPKIRILNNKKTTNN
jgi:ABC-2 type transport system ATP-binding protein